MNQTTHEQSFEEYLVKSERELARKLRLPLAESNHLVSEYESLLSVKHGEKFIRRFEGLWLYQRRHGRLKQYQRVHTLMHLLGKGPFGVFRLQRTRVLVVDLDAKDNRARASLEARYHAVRSAFGGSGCVVLRSSDSPAAGLHVYYFLKSRHRSRPLRAWAERALAARRIQVSPGKVELFPNPTQGVRLPLGSGSLMLDPDTLRPIAFVIENGTAVLDLAEALPLFLRTASEKAIAAISLFGDAR